MKPWGDPPHCFYFSWHQNNCKTPANIFYLYISSERDKSDLVCSCEEHSKIIDNENESHMLFDDGVRWARYNKMSLDEVLVWKIMES